MVEKSVLAIIFTLEQALPQGTDPKAGIDSTAAGVIVKTTHNSTAPMAGRHLTELGITGVHLKKSKDYDPASGALATPKNRFERQVDQADHHVVPDFPLLDNSALFLLGGKPPHEAGDVLIELTQSWRTERVEVLQPGDSDAIYAVLCL